MKLCELTKGMRTLTSRAPVEEEEEEEEEEEKEEKNRKIKLQIKIDDRDKYSMTFKHVCTCMAEGY